MRRIMALCIVLLFFTSSLLSVMPLPSAEEISLDETEYYAVIIGVETFEGLEFPEEDKIDDGAIAMYNKFLNSSNWKEENMKLLLNENATKNDIRESITHWLDDKEDENDIVLYYFTGHSWKMPILERLKGKGHTYTYPYDASDTKYSDGKITDIELDSWLDELESRHVVVILDTCYSGRMLALRQRGRIILTAGGKYLFCPVDEDDMLGNGIFSYFLLQGFDGVADINDDGWVSAEEVFRYARWPTFWFSLWKQFPFNKYLPLIFGPQLPYLYDRHPGQIPLIQLLSD